MPPQQPLLGPGLGFLRESQEWFGPSPGSILFCVCVLFVCLQYLLGIEVAFDRVQFGSIVLLGKTGSQFQNTYALKHHINN